MNDFFVAGRPSTFGYKAHGVERRRNVRTGLAGYGIRVATCGLANSVVTAASVILTLDPQRKLAMTAAVKNDTRH